MVKMYTHGIQSLLFVCLIVAGKGAEKPKDVNDSLLGNKLLDAVGMGKLSEVEKLLGEGANVNHTNNYGESSAHLAAISGSKEILQIIIARGGNVNAATNGVYDGHEQPVRRTPLMWFVNGCQLEAVQLLVNAGADVNYVNEEGQTALDILAAFDHEQDNRCAQIDTLLKAKGGLSGKDATLLGKVEPRPTIGVLS